MRLRVEEFDRECEFFMGAFHCEIRFLDRLAPLRFIRRGLLPSCRTELPWPGRMHDPGWPALPPVVFVTISNQPRILLRVGGDSVARGDFGAWRHQTGFVCALVIFPPLALLDVGAAEFQVLVRDVDRDSRSSRWLPAAVSFPQVDRLRTRGMGPGRSPPQRPGLNDRSAWVFLHFRPARADCLGSRIRYAANLTRSLTRNQASA